MSSLFKLYPIILIVALLTLTACGGSDDSADPEPNLGSGNPVPNSNSSGGSSSDNSGSLAKPTIDNTTQMGDSIEVYWTESNASQYRVIYWQGSDIPQEFLTTSTVFTSPPVSSTGEYTVLVEAYDELGNSLFSYPSTITIL